MGHFPRVNFMLISDYALAPGPTTRMFRIHLDVEVPDDNPAMWEALEEALAAGDFGAAFEILESANLLGFDSSDEGGARAYKLLRSAMEPPSASAS